MTVEVMHAEGHNIKHHCEEEFIRSLSVVNGDTPGRLSSESVVIQ